jgi:hypothetical protein
LTSFCLIHVASFTFSQAAQRMAKNVRILTDFTLSHAFVLAPFLTCLSYQTVLPHPIYCCPALRLSDFEESPVAAPTRARAFAAAIDTAHANR